MTAPAHLVITDSGLGGLAICAGIELALRRRAATRPTRITFVNAWPEEGRGYNDLADMDARAAAFDRALDAIDAMAPDRLVIACNTLSIVYERTRHRRAERYPVHGIVGAGVEQFANALHQHRGAPLVLLGTRTTIASGVHARALLALGFSAERVSGSPCHGLATAIEADTIGPATERAIDACCASAVAAAGAGTPLLAGLCCTHYGFVKDRIESALARHALRPVVALDPNAGLVLEVAAACASPSGAAGGGHAHGSPSVSVVSKVTLPDAKRRNVADLLGEISPATARALREYAHAPELF